MLRYSCAVVELTPRKSAPAHLADRRVIDTGVPAESEQAVYDVDMTTVVLWTSYRSATA
jgi:hypothetical protein